jgi:hypothetical protein
MMAAFRRTSALLALAVLCAVALGICLAPLGSVALVAAVAGAIVVMVLGPPFLLFRAVARGRSHRAGGGPGMRAAPPRS